MALTTAPRPPPGHSAPRQLAPGPACCVLSLRDPLGLVFYPVSGVAQTPRCGTVVRIQS